MSAKLYKKTFCKNCGDEMYNLESDVCSLKCFDEWVKLNT